MLAGLRFALSDFFIFTYTKLKNSDIENFDFPNISQKRLKKQSEEETYF